MIFFNFRRYLGIFASILSKCGALQEGEARTHACYWLLPAWLRPDSTPLDRSQRGLLLTDEYRAALSFITFHGVWTVLRVKSCVVEFCDWLIRLDDQSQS